jgi:hypothetical protein
MTAGGTQDECSGKNHRVPIPRETLGRKPVSDEPSLWPLLRSLQKDTKPVWVARGNDDDEMILI